MYIKWNDFELIYLIRENIEAARVALYNKYKNVIKNEYLISHFYDTMAFCDFLQEGYMCMEMALHKYNDDKCFSFYKYYQVCFRHHLGKLKRKYRLSIRESILYLNLERKKTYTKNDSAVLFKLFNLYDDIERKLIESCILGRMKIKEFSEKYNISYNKTYRMYQKIKRDLEKNLTILQ